MNLAQALYLTEAGTVAWRDPEPRSIMLMEFERRPIYAIAALSDTHPRASGITRRYTSPEDRVIRQGTLAHRFLQGLHKASRKLSYPDICARIECPATRANREVLTELVRIGKLSAGGSRTHRVYWHPDSDWE